MYCVPVSSLHSLSFISSSVRVHLVVSLTRNSEAQSMSFATVNVSLLSSGNQVHQFLIDIFLYTVFELPRNSGVEPPTLSCQPLPMIKLRPGGRSSTPHQRFTEVGMLLLKTSL